MKETLDRIWRRFKKLFILLILLPFLTAGAAYFFQKTGPVSYTASAEIQLANFGNANKDYLMFTDAEHAKTYIAGDLLENVAIDADKAKSKINFVIKPAKVLGISYTGDTSKETERTLKLIVNEYVNESKEKKDFIANNYNNDKSIAGPESGILPGEYDIMIKGLTPVNDVQKVQLDQPQESSKNTAIFGFLIGLILSSMILLLPEVFRK